MPHSPTSLHQDTSTHPGGEHGVKDNAYYPGGGSSTIATSSSTGSNAAGNGGRAITKSNSASNGFSGFTPQHLHRDLWAQRSLSHPNTFYANGSPVANSYPFVYNTDYQQQAQFLTSPQHTYSATPYQTFTEPAYARPQHENHRVPQSTNPNIRFIRPPLSPPTNHDEEFAYPTSDVNSDPVGNATSMAAATSANELATELAKGLNVASSKWAGSSPNSGSADFEDSDSEEDDQSSHPNKFPVEIEYHENKYCLYKRQPTRSGLKVKQIKSSVYDPMTSETRSQMQQIKYYQKDLVRICRCGKYNQMDGALVHGRANDCDGYEIHYSQKCKWKAYDDYKTGKRVLIRLCKCYKPMA